MTMVGTPIYVAPEVVMSGRYTKKIDSYSYGVCIVACVRSEENIARFFQHGLRRKMKKKNIMGLGMGMLAKRVNERGWRPELPTALFSWLKKLIEACWDQDPEKRPDFDEIVERMNGVVRSEIELQREPVFTCDFGDPANNDKDYEARGAVVSGGEAGEGTNDDDKEEEIETLRAKLRRIEGEKKELEKELATTRKFAKQGEEDDQKVANRTCRRPIL